MTTPWEYEPEARLIPAAVSEQSGTTPRLESPPPTNIDSSRASPDPAQSGKLEQLQQELQRVKLERERLHQLQQLESRETELERMIEQEISKRSWFD